MSLPLRKRTAANDAFNVAFVGLTLDSGIRQPIGRVAARAVKRTVASFPISGVLSTEAGKHYSHFASSTGVAVSPVGRHIWSEGFSAPASRRGFFVATLEVVARFQGFAPLF